MRKMNLMAAVILLSAAGSRSKERQGFTDANFGIGFYFFGPQLWDHGQALSSLQLVRLQGGHRALWTG